MGFGRNPYVPKAQAAEQKATDATNESARARAYRDAAHQWDRASGREPPGKRRLDYERNAARNRDLADGGAATQNEDAESDGDKRHRIDAKLVN